MAAEHLIPQVRLEEPEEDRMFRRIGFRSFQHGLHQRGKSTSPCSGTKQHNDYRDPAARWITRHVVFTHINVTPYVTVRTGYDALLSWGQTTVGKDHMAKFHYTEVSESYSPLYSITIALERGYDKCSLQRSIMTALKREL
ncbi:hypothetical protein JOB18_007411 [Solea senegalensis]|uniref:Uncharacterized protein n=1 Tax=Solea senegalensis TaxID=28829 RepID=A0AAV6PVF2_SOLSE|nr:hypothetical protein JOB18_007411 [Solea senegalensis]